MLPQRIPAGSEGQSISGQYGQMWNSIAEHQRHLSNSALRFVLILCRRGWDESTVTDRTWEDWTGLDAKMKRHAIRELKDKGLHVSGHGDKARYSFERETWTHFARHAPRTEKAKTVGRSKSVTAPAGMQVHEDCRENGCGRMCGVISPANESNPVIPFPPTKDWKPVSKNAESPPGQDPPKVVAETPPSQVLDAEIVSPNSDTAKSLVPAVKPQTPSGQLQELLGIFLSRG